MEEKPLDDLNTESFTLLEILDKLSDRYWQALPDVYERQIADGLVDRGLLLKRDGAHPGDCSMYKFSNGD